MGDKLESIVIRLTLLAVVMNITPSFEVETHLTSQHLLKTDIFENSTESMATVVEKFPEVLGLDVDVIMKANIQKMQKEYRLNEER